MTGRKYIAITSLLAILVIEITVYGKMKDTLPRCFPTGDVFPYYDSSGNRKYDSVYHKISDFKLQDQNGEVITGETTRNKIYVADFFFCACPTICPKMAKNLYSLQEEFIGDDRFVILSHTVNPKHDTVPALKKYAERYNVNGKKWHLLTGPRHELYKLSKGSYFLGVKNDSPNSFMHSEKFVLVDQNRIIRGYYDGTDGREVKKLKRHIKILIGELNN